MMHIKRKNNRNANHLKHVSNKHKEETSVQIIRILLLQWLSAIFSSELARDHAIFSSELARDQHQKESTKR